MEKCISAKSVHENRMKNLDYKKAYAESKPIGGKDESPLQPNPNLGSRKRITQNN